MSSTDITKPVDLTIHAEGTGPLRSRRPVYMDFMPPCNSACPAGENIQAWMAHAQSGNYEEAFQTLIEDCPFPATMGRICVKPCETGCNRNHIDDTINIHAVERYIGDEAIKNGWKPRFEVKPSGKRILVVGAGPGGLAAAYHLARMGHTVEIFETDARPGGLLWSGIPDYRLPKDILEEEINRITQLGVTIRTNYRVVNLADEKKKGNFDAVYLSLGAQIIRSEEFEQDGSVHITDAFGFFKAAKGDPTPFSNKKVLVYGGGKLALYLARMIKRYGSTVTVHFPGDKKMMPAYDYETEDALAEGVTVELLSRIRSVKQRHVEMEQLKIEKGKVGLTGEEKTIEADIIVLANKQESDSAFLKSFSGIKIHEDGTVAIDAGRMTGENGIFAGGDMLPGENRSATIAMGHGKKAARYIHAYVTGESYLKPEKHPTAGYRKLHMWYKTDAPQKEQDRLAPAIAIKSFNEIMAGLSEAEARFEAQRCLSCGNCFECDGCFGACPEDAIIKLGKGNRYRFNYDACTGCAVCFEQCPCHAIEMTAEPLNAPTHVSA